MADEMELRRHELRLFVNAGGGVDGAPRWASAPFGHPTTLDVVAMDPDLKALVRANMEIFTKGRTYYHRLSCVWCWSCLLHGPPITGSLRAPRCCIVPWLDLEQHPDAEPSPTDAIKASEARRQGNKGRRQHDLL
ncbi:AAA-ATPase [Hordeum vulgare]|nr:AAA-ATPase [Hordeum vulgare]